MLGKRNADELEFHETEFSLVLAPEENVEATGPDVQSANPAEEKSARTLRHRIKQHSDFNESLGDLMNSSRKLLPRVERDRLDSNYMNQNYDPERMKSNKKLSFQPEIPSLDEVLQNSKKKYFGIELEKKDKECPLSYAKSNQPAEKGCGLFGGDPNVVLPNDTPLAAGAQSEKQGGALRNNTTAKKGACCDNGKNNTEYMPLEEVLSNKKYSQLELRKQNPEVKLMYSRVERARIDAQANDNSPIKQVAEIGSLEDLMKNSLKKTTRMTQEKEMAAQCHKMEGNLRQGGKTR